MWHVTCDRWEEVNLLSKFQVPSLNGLEFLMCRRLGGNGSVIESVCDKGVCRTAPATPGLLKTRHIFPNVRVNTWTGLYQIGKHIWQIVLNHNYLWQGYINQSIIYFKTVDLLDETCFPIVNLRLAKATCVYLTSHGSEFRLQVWIYMATLWPYVTLTLHG